MIILITILLLASTLTAQDTNIQTATPTNPAVVIKNENVTSTPVKDSVSDVTSLLDEIEKACTQLKSYQADMKYDTLQSMQDDQKIRTGQLYYKSDDKSILARIHFTDLSQIDLMDTESQPAVTKFNEDYYFDGLWVVRTSEDTKTVQRWEVAKDRQDREAFRIGNGPFPLPFAIKTSDVLEHFEVKLNAPPRRTKAENAICLTMTPKPTSSYAKEYKLVELWVNKDNLLPVQVCYVKQDLEENTVIWSNIKINQDIKDSMFTLPKTPSGWTEETTLLDENTGK